MIIRTCTALAFAALAVAGCGGNTTASMQKLPIGSACTASTECGTGTDFFCDKDQTLLTVGQDNRARFWEVGTGNLRRQFPVLRGAEGQGLAPAQCDQHSVRDAGLERHPA